MTPQQRQLTDAEAAELQQRIDARISDRRRVEGGDEVDALVDDALSTAGMLLRQPRDARADMSDGERERRSTATRNRGGRPPLNVGECTVPGCKRPAATRGMCRMHYLRVRRAERKRDANLAAEAQRDTETVARWVEASD